MGGKADQNGCKQLQIGLSVLKRTKKPLDLQFYWKSRGLTFEQLWSKKKPSY